jgi:hypothetical protein
MSNSAVVYLLLLTLDMASFVPALRMATIVSCITHASLTGALRSSTCGEACALV